MLIYSDTIACRQSVLEALTFVKFMVGHFDRPSFSRPSFSAPS